MSDDNESPLVTAIQESAFGELNHLINLYNRYESLADCLTLMEPDNLRQIIIDAANQLTHICMSCLEEIYEDFQQENPRANVSKIKPSISRINDYHNTILGNTQMIEREINQYESFFDGFIHSLGQDNDSNNVYGAGAIGSVIGGTLFGPVGGFIGGFALETISGFLAEDEREEKGEELCNYFVSVLELTESFLENMANNCLELIDQYIERLNSET